MAAVVAAVSAIRGKPAAPERCATDAKHVIALQRATGTPWAELSEQLVLVAEWAKDSPDRMAARDIRAEGWEEGTDRSRSVGTLCVLARWADRLDAAERWRRGETVRPRARGEHSSERAPRPTDAELALNPEVWEPL